MVKSDESTTVEWLVSQFALCINMSNASLDWRSAIVVPLFKGNGEKKDCNNYRCIS
jgi:hypothetical protein